MRPVTDPTRPEEASEQATEADEIATRLREVRARIDDAAQKAGRTPGSVRLVAVSKGKPASAIRAAYAAGQREFGENYAQELEEKASQLADLEGLVWHAIGQLQRNKARTITRVAAFVHAVDRVEIAEELGRRAAGKGKRIKALVEVNVSGETSKGGCAPSDAGTVLAAIRKAPGLEAVGLMTIPPDSDDPEVARRVFAELRALRDEHGGVAKLSHLSMGMTHDFPIAVAEGATLVRVGTAIFGARTRPVA